MKDDMNVTDDARNFYRGIVNVAYLYGIIGCLVVSGYGVWKLLK